MKQTLSRPNPPHRSNRSNRRTSGRRSRLGSSCRRSSRKTMHQPLSRCTVTNPFVWEANRVSLVLWGGMSRRVSHMTSAAIRNSKEDCVVAPPVHSRNLEASRSKTNREIRVDLYGSHSGQSLFIVITRTCFGSRRLRPFCPSLFGSKLRWNCSARNRSTSSAAKGSQP